MGGLGSGRQGGRGTTTRHLTLDVRQLQRDGLLTPGRAFDLNWSRNGEEVAAMQVQTEIDRVILKYQHCGNGGDWQAIEYPVLLEWTPCNLGGQRAWFICPARGCGRRVAILYSGKYYACRHCYRLAYQCQRETYGDRSMRRADKLRKRLGWCPGIANPRGGKPKGMHWKTYWRLNDELNGFVGVSLAESMEWLRARKWIRPSL